MKKVVFLILLSAVFLGETPVKNVVGSTDKKAYYHFEIIKIFAEPKNVQIPEELRNEKITAVVVFESNVVTTIGGLANLYLSYSSSTARWEGSWPCPWNAPDGEYEVKLHLSDKLREQNLTIDSMPAFKITRKKPTKFSNPACVITMEDSSPIISRRVVNPDGKATDWKGLLDWIEFTGADTFWVLTGVTEYYVKPLDPEFPWITNNLDCLAEVGRECHKRGIKFGVWAMAYITDGKEKYAPKYEFAVGYNNGTLSRTRSISIRDEKRVDDLIKFYKRISSVPEIDYFGIDYIRNALGGYELVDDFVREMNPKLPDGWEKFSRDERIFWLARKKVARKDKYFIDQWQWWRARRCSLILKRIIEEVKFTKPFWAFTLSWEKGWQHGQDPIMFNDAGIDMDSIMLYECNRPQYDALIKDWHRYVYNDQVNLVVGNEIDWPLHQSTLNPAGPEEFFNRIMTAVDQIYADSGMPQGIFLHCLNRALGGRRGPYPKEEWLYTGASAFSELRRKSNSISFGCNVDVPQHLAIGTQVEAKINLERFNPDVKETVLNVLPSADVAVSGPEKQKIVWETGVTTKTVSIPFRVSSVNYARGLRYILPVKLEWDEKNQKQKYFAFKYFNASVKSNEK